MSPGPWWVPAQVALPAGDTPGARWVWRSWFSRRGGWGSLRVWDAAYFTDDIFREMTRYW